ncbi:MAG: PfkB family carbohydrate kinase [Pseudomonadota bacterium]
MTLHVFGSINIDHVYAVPHAPVAGETLAAAGYEAFLGGKGANQAIAAARAGAPVRLAGAVGQGAEGALAELAGAGVNTEGVAQLAAPTGHAVIYVEPSGENRIVIFGGANRALTPAVLEAALAAARPGDWWLTQNETALVAESMAAARAKGLRTAHAAAPFDPEACAAVLPHTDLLAVNEGEAAALASHLETVPEALPVPMTLVTRGGEGATWRDAAGTQTVPAFAVAAVDTTGAGDCFLGTLLAGLDTGLATGDALRRAAAAAAITVTRPGAASAIPNRAAVDAFLAGQPA